MPGRFRKRPPIDSALKGGGEPLYAKARRGEVVEVEEREVDVHAFELQSAADLLDAGEPLLRLRVECGSGSYVRSLVRDLGAALGCGAHVAELRRLWVDQLGRASGRERVCQDVENTGVAGDRKYR